MTTFDEDRDWEAEQEGAEEAAYGHLYDQIGPQWAQDHAEELAREHYGENYEEAIKDFTSERLQSYFLLHPDVAIPANEMRLCSESLVSSFPAAALVFAVISTELTVKDVLLKPIVSGLVHADGLASFIMELTTHHTGMNRFYDLLTKILAEFGGVDLKTFRRLTSKKTLWEEIGEVQTARNAVIHRGDLRNSAKAALAISVASTLLTEILPQILSKLGLHLEKSMTITVQPTPNST